jgi:Phosphotransferase enzyme family
VIDLTDRAVLAATAVARRYGIRSARPVVVTHHTNAVIHLVPAPVVARVATVTAAFRQGSAWLEREVAVAAFLARAGTSVVPPSSELPPGPHEQDGLQLTFWRYVAGEGNVDPTAAGAALLEIHAALASYPGELPSLDPLRETDRLLGLVRLDRDDGDLLARAREEAAEALASLPPPRQPLHGDAHLSNVIPTAAGPLWLDLEDTCVGPIEWDLACLVTPARIWRNPAGEVEALAAYGQHDEALVESLVPLRALFTTAWGLYALAQGARDPYRTARRLAWWRDRYALEM